MRGFRTGVRMGRFGAALIGIIGALGLLGCDNAATNPPNAISTPKGSPQARATSDHDPHDADHDHDGEAHEHHHTPPHGGALVELGEHESQFEVVLDAASGKLTAYVLDAHAENAVRLNVPQITLRLRSVGDKPLPNGEREIQLQAVGNALTGETSGDTSVFAAEVSELVGAARFEAILPIISVKGREYRDVLIPFPEGRQ